MHRPLPVSEQQWQRIFAFIHSEILMTPQEFISKWDVTQAFMAEICDCDESTVSSWFASGRSYSPPLRHHKLALALADLILSDFERCLIILKGYFSLMGIVS
ncbi:hypothetical protein Cri9333_4744 (plasmid) [Crinalium epipsammum PCC 9333]|uniref:Uncharacterized protein n=1 Tax=Crinalium epipsammum PCC 9333 TaxID=1173022 RepID=K9W7T4_9CYAN|nr:hypothetical protein [Crinalium epipsammum]AFZ15520.1 hypothetical protein Cri9333_4744 [Crinalium epipsammum PCC 9333]